MKTTAPRMRSQRSRRRSRTATIGGKLAALAGTAGGLAAVEVQAEPLTYVPTAGIAAAKNIPGFVFVSSTNVTLGALRPPTSSPGTTAWDVDGNSTTDFNLNLNFTSSAPLASFQPLGANRLLGYGTATLANVAASDPVNAAAIAAHPLGGIFMTSNGLNAQLLFSDNTPGQFGFMFTSGSSTYYGWGTLTVQPGANRFTISEAYYNSVAGAGINVGEVPVAAVSEPSVTLATVPEPSNMALLAIGSAGVVAWRARRRQA